MSDRRTTAKLAVWHAGEKAIQEKIGVAERMEGVGQRVIRDFMPDQHREFYSQIPSSFSAASTARATPGPRWWRASRASSPLPHRARSTLMCGASPAIRQAKGCATATPSGCSGSSCTPGAAIASTAFSADPTVMDFVSRSIKVSGTVRSTSSCADYALVRDPREPFAGDVEETSGLDQKARDVIGAADTFFVASYAERENRRQVDVSHRGGKAGFVRVADDGTLTIPDFAGNLFSPRWATSC